jgi:aspartate/methionine/tyrosine aminotransferase
MLNAFCREHNLAIIADEVFLDYQLSSAPRSFAGNREVLTFTLSGLSKMRPCPK